MSKIVLIVSRVWLHISNNMARHSMFRGMTDRLFEVDDKATGANVLQDGSPNGGVEDKTEPVFDPSTVDSSDVEALARLNDEQLAAVQGYKKPDAPDAGSDKDTPAADTAPVNEPVKLAGKYATSEELVKGVSEISSKLGYPASLVQAVLALAQKSGDFSSVEALYKSAEKELGERGTQAPKPPAAPATDTPAVDTHGSAEVQQAVTSLTMSQIQSSALAQRMQAKGLQLPQNMEEFDSLVDVNPYFAMEFRQTFQELFQKNLGEANAYNEAAKTVESANASVVEADLKAVQDFATENGIKLSEAELGAIKVSALGRAYNYDAKHGHQFLRPGAVKETFFATVLPSKLQEIALNKQTEGRTQAIADLDRAAKKEVVGLGTSRISTKTRAIAKMPDLSDPDVVSKLPDAALNDPESYFKSFAK